MTPKDISSSQNSLREIRKGKRKYKNKSKVYQSNELKRGKTCEVMWLIFLTRLIGNHYAKPMSALLNAQGGTTSYLLKLPCFQYPPLELSHSDFPLTFLSTGD